MTYNQNYVPSHQSLREIFHKLDKDDCGSITAEALQEALSNGPWKQFNIGSARFMIDMFGQTKPKTINLDEFTSLWKYIAEWYNCFRLFDRDSSGTIDRKELRAALFKFGYAIGEEVLNVIMRKYDRGGRGAIHFHDFVRICITIQNATSLFREFDDDSDGWIKISYNQFLAIAFRTNV